jgi:hypothetical protein
MEASPWFARAVGAVVVLTFAWAVGIVMKFNRLQHELEERRSDEQRALTALYVRIYNQALARGDRAAAREVQLQGFALGIDVAKGGSWSHGS